MLLYNFIVNEVLNEKCEAKVIERTAEQIKTDDKSRILSRVQTGSSASVCANEARTQAIGL